MVPFVLPKGLIKHFFVGPAKCTGLNRFQWYWKKIHPGDNVHVYRYDCYLCECKLLCFCFCPKIGVLISVCFWGARVFLFAFFYNFFRIPTSENIFKKQQQIFITVVGYNTRVNDTKLSCTFLLNKLFLMQSSSCSRYSFLLCAFAFCPNIFCLPNSFTAWSLTWPDIHDRSIPLLYIHSFDCTFQDFMMKIPPKS